MNHRGGKFIGKIMFHNFTISNILYSSIKVSELGKGLVHIDIPFEHILKLTKL